MSSEELSRGKKKKAQKTRRDILAMGWQPGVHLRFEN
jgi:hypothetical protein